MREVVDEVEVHFLSFEEVRRFAGGKYGEESDQAQDSTKRRWELVEGHISENGGTYIRCNH